MNEHEKCHYDLNGSLVVRGILGATQVAAINEAIDNNQNHVRLRDGDLPWTGTQERRTLLY